MKRGLHFSGPGDPLVRAAKVLRGVDSEQRSAEAIMVAMVGGGAERSVSSDSDGSGDLSGNCASDGDRHTFQETGPALAFPERAKCHVCLWPRGSAQCYHWDRGSLCYVKWFYHALSYISKMYTLIHVNCCVHHRAHYRLSGFSFQLCNCNIVLDCNERKIL